MALKSSLTVALHDLHVQNDLEHYLTGKESKSLDLRRPVTTRPAKPPLGETD